MCRRLLLDTRIIWRVCRLQRVIFLPQLNSKPRFFCIVHRIVPESPTIFSLVAALMKDLIMVVVYSKSGSQLDLVTTTWCYCFHFIDFSNLFPNMLEVPAKNQVPASLELLVRPPKGFPTFKPISVTTTVLGSRTASAGHVGQNNSANVASRRRSRTNDILVTETGFISTNGR